MEHRKDNDVVIVIGEKSLEVLIKSISVRVIGTSNGKRKEDIDSENI